ncbi:MAG TPA: hypothetical protein VF921_07945 [Vicinamibacterales bacterium]
MRTPIAAALALALATMTTVTAGSAQQKPTHADADRLVQGTGQLPSGWKARLDKPDAKLDTLKVLAEQNALEFQTGPAGIYYKPNMKAANDYEVSASFSQLEPAALPEEYGLIIAGGDLDKDTQRYTCFLVRQDARFSIQKRAGTATKVAVAWRPVPAMKEPKGVKSTNTLIVRAHGNMVRFFIGDKEVAKLTRAQVGGDGIVGLRINHNLHVQVSKFEVKKLP